MSRVHTKLPSDNQYGEYLVAQFLTSVPDNDLELWFNLDPNGIGEIDVVLAHPKLGIQFIEVKGHSINQVHHYDPSNVQMDKASKTHPALLVRRKAQIFASINKELYRAAPYVNSTIWWPRISRREWEAKFNTPIINRDTDAMLFADELRGWDGAYRKLDRLWDYPLRGQTVSEHNRRILKDAHLKQVREILGSAEQIENISSKLRNQIKRPTVDSTKYAQNFPFGPVYNVEISGPPGTGKTTKLREIGLLHAKAGSDVLFVCFNKSLAATMRREIRVLRDGESLGSFQAVDMWDLMKHVLPDVPIPKLSSPVEFAQCESARVLKLRQTPLEERIRYDTILIDEAQDLPSAAFELLRELTVPSGSWFVSYGSGQEIYNFERSWEERPCSALKEWRKTPGWQSSRRQRQRSYRLSEAGYLIARTFLDHFPNMSKSDELLEKMLHKPKAEAKLPAPNSAKNLAFDFGEDFQDFGESSSETFNIEALPLKPNNSAKNPFVIDKGALETAILNQVSQATDQSGHRDLLILVRPNSHVYHMLKAILRRNNLAAHDLVDKSVRRQEPLEDEIIISGHQNSRGLTGENVLVFDFEDITHPHAPTNNLFYIALSRGWRNTTIFLDLREQSEASGGRYLQRIINTISQHTLGIANCQTAHNPDHFEPPEGWIAKAPIPIETNL